MMKLASSLILALGCAVVGNATAEETLDLYVREKFDDASCSTCAEGLDGCLLKSRALFLQDSCFNRSDRKASVYSEVDDGVVCRKDFGTSCDFEGAFAFEAAASSTDECKSTWTLDECDADLERMTKLEGWCTSSTSPDGEFVTPLLTFKEYRGLDGCGTADYAHLHLADEGGSCVPLSFPTEDGTYAAGSRRATCDGDAFAASRYESEDCSGEALRTYTDGSTDECPEEGSEEEEGGRVYTNDCGAPAIHCKAFPFLGKGSKEEEEEEEIEAVVEDASAANGADVSAPQSQPPSAAFHRPTMCGLFVVGAITTAQIHLGDLWS